MFSFVFYLLTGSYKIFFQALSEYIRNPQHTLQALRLLTSVASKQGAHVDMIVETKCMKSLIKVLQATTDITILGIGVADITMILPVIPTHIPSLLPEMFAVIRNALSFPALPSSVTKQVQWFLQHLYGMFPVMSVNLLKDMKRNNAQLVTKLEVCTVGFIVTYCLQSPAYNFPLKIQCWYASIVRR